MRRWLSYANWLRLRLSRREATMSGTDDARRRAAMAVRIKEARKLAGLSQGQVAQMLGLHRPAVSEMEAGNRRVSTDELLRLAGIFDVSVSWLLGEAPDTLQPDDPRLELAAGVRR